MKKNIKKKEILDVWFVNGKWLHADVRFKGHKFCLYASDASERIITLEVRSHCVFWCLT